MAKMTSPSRERAPRFRDARGKPVTLLDPYLLHRFRRYDTIPAEELAAIAADLGSGLNRTTRFLLVVGVVCALIGVIAFAGHVVAALSTGRSVFPLPKLLPIANVWVGPFMLWVGASRIRVRRIRSVMLAHLRCPHCGYDIRRLRTAPEDGATVCPECGCAWKLEDAKTAGDQVGA